MLTANDTRFEGLIITPGWGAKVIDQLSADLRAAFPDARGFSSRNLKYMKVFAQECPDLEIGQQSAAQLPWFHIVTLITKLSDHSLRDWYAREALAQSWPRETLNIQIKSQLHLRKGAAVTNFDQRLAPPHAEEIETALSRDLEIEEREGMPP